MNKSRVAVIRCDSYDQDRVNSAVRRGIDLLGGVACFGRPGEKILLKPNLLVGTAPENCVTTHPAVLSAVGRIFGTVTEKLYYGDSNGFPGKTLVHMQRSGLAQAAEATGIDLADFNEGEEIPFHDSPFTKRFTIARVVREMDGIVNLPKFKSHGFTRMTGAVKNMFGCIPGLLKPEFHVKIADPFDFGRMLVALNLLIPARLHIMDGIMAMEGNGPRSGDPVSMNVLLFSADPVALDAVMCRLVDMDPEVLTTSKPGKEWGLGSYLSEEIELVGDGLESLINRAFDVVRRPPEAAVTRGWVSALKRPVSPRPRIDSKLCVRCGVCVDVCPVKPKALSWPDDKDKAPVYDYNRCIRCYCCQELCPERAIDVKIPLLGRLIFYR